MMKRHILNGSSLLSIALAMTLTACGTTPDDNSEDPGVGPGDYLESSLSRDLSPAVDEATQEQLSADNREFAFDLLEEIRQGESGNLFYSPHSISIALAMTYPGAMGDTKTEMAEVLNFRLAEEELHPAFNALDLALDARSEVEVDDGDPPTLRVVNATWGQKDYPFSGDYLDILATHYGAGLRAVDFENEPNVVREEINQWVEDQTEERIKDLLPEGSIRSSTRLVLTNAIYFLAGWQKPFPEYGTSDRAFARLDGTEVETAMMSQTEEFPYFEDEETMAISLPYVGEELSLIAMMPAEEAAFEDWEAALDLESFDAIVEGLSMGYGGVLLPSFEVEGDYDVKVLFEAMGWENFADLRAMLEDEMGGLEITDILHKSFIKLDEEGTEAAAATAVVVGETSAPEMNFEMHFDRPFYYAIYDHPTESILFLGRMMDPTE